MERFKIDVSSLLEDLRPGLILSWAALAACSTSHPQVAEQKEVGADEACQEFATALCAQRWDCIPLAFSYGHGFGDSFGTEEVCVARTLLACRGWQRLSGTTATTPAALRSCAAELSESDCRISTHTLTRPAAGCGFEQGALGEGASCELDLQCESARCGAIGGASTCAAALPNQPELGAPCGVSRTCGDNLVCVDGACAAPSLEGEACGEGQPACAEYAELHCAAARVCAPPPTSQSVCGNQELALGGYTACAAGECVNRNDMGRGSCRPYAADDDACDSYAGPACLYPAQCVNGHCRVPAL